MKYKMTAVLLAVSLLAGCSSEVPAGESEAQMQTEKFNVIQNNIDDSKYEEAFSEMFADTLSAYNSKIEIDADSHGTFAVLKDGSLGTESADRQTSTVAFVQDDLLYIITDTADDLLSITRYGSDGGKSVTIEQKENESTGIVHSIGGGTKDVKSNEERQESLLAGLFSMSDSIALNPDEDPDYFEFTNSDTGTGFVCSIDIRDFDAFNKENKARFADGFTLDGEPVDDINVKMDYFDVVINNEGVISSITNVIEISYTLNGQSKEEKYSVTTNIYSYDYEKFNTSEIDKIFSGIDDGSIAVGDTVSLTISE